MDDASPVPPYEQVRGQIARLIRSGVLPEGTRLPAIRQLAADLRLAPGTIARAYAELEREGLVGGRGRQGTRVRAGEAAGGPRDLAPQLAEMARLYAVGVVRLGVTAQQARDAVEGALAESFAAVEANL